MIHFLTHFALALVAFLLGALVGRWFERRQARKAYQDSAKPAPEDKG